MNNEDLQAIALQASLGVGTYIVNDYLITVAQSEDGNGYTLTIRKGAEVQTIHLTELTQEYVDNCIQTALAEAKASGEFDGNGIERIVFNDDYTLTIYFTQTEPYTTGNIRGAVGNGIQNIVLNDDYTLTINYTDGNSVTTDPIRGATGNGISGISFDSQNYTLTINFTDGESFTTGSIRGATGNGIASVRLNQDYTLTITYTDGNSVTTSSIRGAKGDTGITPDISIGTVSTLAPNEPATAEITGTPEEPVLSLGIPKGNTGATPAFTIGTVTTLDPSEDATATISGTPEAPVLSLGIPQGIKGDTGEISEEEFEAGLDRLAIHSEATAGDVVTITDGADGMPVKKLIVGIEPVQDLHGYDNPWPAGGGKNLLPNTLETTTSNGITATVNSDGSITLNGTATAGGSFAICAEEIVLPERTDYVFNGGADGGSSSTYRLYGEAYDYALESWYGKQLTAASYNQPLTDTDKIRNIRIQFFNGAVINNITFYPMIRKATETDATYAPYSNICPITGWTGAEIVKTGKNLLKSTFDRTGVYYNSTGVVSAQQLWGIIYIPVKKNAHYTISGIVTDNGTYFVWLDGEKHYISNVGQHRNYDDVVAPDGAEYMGLSFLMSESSVNYDLDTAQIEYGSEATAYEPFVTNDVIPITFPTEAGTVYGGHVEIKDGEAKLVVTSESKVFDGSEPWTTNSNTNVYYATLNKNDFPYPFKSDVYSVCDKYKYKGTAASRYSSFLSNGEFGLYYATTTSNVREICFKNQSVASLEDWTAILAQNPITVVYELAEPITYTLDPVTLTTIQGLNHIWANTGDITELEYSSDPKTYIDTSTSSAKQSVEEMISARTDSMTAPKNLTTGELIVADGVLYKATANITSGTTLTPGTNVSVTTLEAEIASVQSDVDSITATIAPEFDASTSYTTGQIVLKNGVLYRFTSDHSGAWTGTDAVVVTVGGEVADLKTDLKSAIGILFNGDISNSSPKVNIDISKYKYLYFEIEGSGTGLYYLQINDSNNSRNDVIGKVSSSAGGKNYCGLYQVKSEDNYLVFTGTAHLLVVGINSVKYIAEVLDNLDTPRNYFIPDNVQVGKYYNTVHNDIRNNSSLSLSDYIYVPSGSVVKVYSPGFTLSSNIGVQLYSWKTGTSSGVLQRKEHIAFIMPADYNAIRVTVYNSNINNVFVEIIHPFTSRLNAICGNLYGKNTVCFGDSVTWYDDQAYTWGKLNGQVCTGYETYMKQNGMIVNNQGISGATMSEIGVAIKSFDFTGYDIVTISSGINDTRKKVAIGATVSPKGTFDTNTFKGALQSAIEHILTANPTIRIVLLTPTQGLIYKNGFSPAETSDGYVDEEYANAMKDIGEVYGLPVCDLYGKCGINPVNALTYMNDPDPDPEVDPNPNDLYSVHPLPIGYKRIADVLIPFLKSII